MYYWERALEKPPKQPKKNDIIVHFVLVNQHSSTGVNKWICCGNMDKLLGLIQYVLLPSTQISRALYYNDPNNEACFGAMGYMDTMNAFREIKTSKRIIDEYTKCFDEVDKFDKTTKIKDMKYILDDTNSKFDYREGILLNLEIYENIEQVGKELIDSYEKYDMIDVLEEGFNLSKKEIESMFENLSENAFMSKRIMSILGNLNMI